ncbi:MAG: OsmC family protein [Candidatus Thorarchaeota archaeon]
MSETHQYALTVRHLHEKIVNVSIKGKEDFRVSTPPDFWPEAPGDVLSPEDLFVASVASCYGVTLAGIAERSHVKLKGFTIEAEGRLKRGEKGWEFENITLHANIGASSEKDIESIEKVAERAHTYCLVSNSLKCPVLVQIEVKVA